MNIQGNINRLFMIGAGVKTAMGAKAVADAKANAKAVETKPKKKKKRKTTQSRKTVTPEMAMNFTRGVGETTIEQHEMFDDLRKALGGYSDGE